MRAAFLEQAAAPLVRQSRPGTEWAVPGFSCPKRERLVYCDVKYFTRPAAGVRGIPNMKKLMVLDGNSIVNRAFYGVSQNLTTRAGQPTNAIFGFLNILNKLLDEEKPRRPVRHL